MTLDVPLRELDTQRLHQGLSEIILVNTLTDVRELKKKQACIVIIWPLFRGWPLLSRAIIEGLHLICVDEVIFLVCIAHHVLSVCTGAANVVGLQ